MDHDLNVIRGRRIRCRPHLERVQALWADMDTAYEAVAEACGFVCDGCPDNCCLTLFYHHTLLEYLCIYEAFRCMDPVQRRETRSRAADVAGRQARAKAAGRSMRVPCPLLLDGRCAAYSSRPMICRLHGLPHELRQPGGSVVQGPGCDVFHRLCRGGAGRRLDRTPIYRQMARLEQDARKALGYRGRIKMTVAEMILTFSAEADRQDPASTPDSEETHA